RRVLRPRIPPRPRGRDRDRARRLRRRTATDRREARRASRARPPDPLRGPHRDGPRDARRDRRRGRAGGGRGRDHRRAGRRAPVGRRSRRGLRDDRLRGGHRDPPPRSAPLLPRRPARRDADAPRGVSRAMTRSALLAGMALVIGACIPPQAEPAATTPAASATPALTSLPPAATTLDMSATLLAKPLPYADGFVLTRTVRGRDGVPAKGFEPVRTAPPGFPAPRRATSAAPTRSRPG